MPTPYITPAMLTSRPAGISWNVVPTLTADSAAQLAQLQDVCWNATSTVDTYCRQPLRATVKTDTSVGPGMPRVAVDRCTRAAMLVTEYRHLVQVAAVQVSQFAAFPPAWNLVPAGQYRPRHPVVTTMGPSTGPIGGTTIDMAAGYVD